MKSNNSNSPLGKEWDQNNFRRINLKVNNTTFVSQRTKAFVAKLLCQFRFRTFPFKHGKSFSATCQCHYLLCPFVNMTLGIKDWPSTLFFFQLLFQFIHFKEICYFTLFVGHCFIMLDLLLKFSCPNGQDKLIDQRTNVNFKPQTKCFVLDILIYY